MMTLSEKLEAAKRKYGKPFAADIRAPRKEPPRQRLIELNQMNRRIILPQEMKA